MSTTQNYRHDPRVVLTLDAGGTTFRFFATRGGRTVAEIPPVATEAENLDRCLSSIVDGFAAVQARCPAPPVAISFAFPGPADYPAGIIGDLPNLPAFRGGVALGPLLAERFRLPVFVNNDGSLFAYGEAIAGFLPFANELLTRAGSRRRYRNLLGVTFGTGFGGGVVHDGALLIGDNAAGGHVWLLRDKLHPDRNAAEGVSIGAVRRVYAELAGLGNAPTPEPRVIAEIARGHAPGQRAAAAEAFRQLGEIAGDAMAQALTLVDGLAVIGGGLARASDLIFPALMAAMNASYDATPGRQRRLGPHVFNLEDPADRERFCQGESRAISIPGSTQTIAWDGMARTAIGLTRLGTSEATTLGAYAFALQELDRPARGEL
jgi:glucokinase